MSAFMVSREHIRYLVSAAKLYGMAAAENPTALGQMLWDENLKSIHARYPDTIGNPPNMPGPIGEDFKYIHQTVSRIDPVQVLKAIQCLEYQSCEHEGWKQSRAKQVLDGLMHHTIDKLPGYDKAQWEIRSLAGVRS